jgi:hypothetical protein
MEKRKVLVGSITKEGGLQYDETEVELGGTEELAMYKTKEAVRISQLVSEINSLVQKVGGNFYFCANVDNQVMITSTEPGKDTASIERFKLEFTKMIYATFRVKEDVTAPLFEAFHTAITINTMNDDELRDIATNTLKNLHKKLAQFHAEYEREKNARKGGEE